jgi:hypothetical protein
MAFPQYQLKSQEHQMKHFLLLAAIATIGAITIPGVTSSAQAAGCYYRLYQDGHGVVTGNLGIQGYASGIKLENACTRARRECNRRFERARKNGQLPRGGPRDFRCIRTSAG